MKTWVLAGLGGLFLAGGLLVPLRHQVHLEADPANPVQRIVLRSRSLLGLTRPAWGARVEGAWGGAQEGFFIAPTAPLDVGVRAWPGYRTTLRLSGSPERSIPGGLRDQGHREAFRAWFVALLEAQLDRPSPAWEPAQRDCAGLLRFAFREAWAPHTAAWRDGAGCSGPPVARDPEGAGPWRQAFPTPEGWQPFARGAYLRELACLPLGREVAEARPGDLLFFSRGGARPQPDHAMAFVRPDSDGQPMLIYHTGPERSAGSGSEGETRRVRLDDLLHHPDPTFRPLEENPAFLGVFRWRVLHSDHER